MLFRTTDQDHRGDKGIRIALARPIRADVLRAVEDIGQRAGVSDSFSIVVASNFSPRSSAQDSLTTVTVKELELSDWLARTGSSLFTVCSDSKTS